MSIVSATNAKNRFGELLDLARSEPVHVQKNGRDVAVIVSAEEFARLTAANDGPKIRPAIEKLLQRSIEGHGALYRALAK